VEACEKRLGKQKPLFFAERDKILKMAHERAKEINGFIYGENENGGTATLYVSRVPFEKIDSRLREKKSSLLLGSVQNPLKNVNSWAKGFLIGPIVSALGAIGLVLYEKKQGAKRIAHSENRKENK
jgi:hypothetical protein